MKARAFYHRLSELQPEDESPRCAIIRNYNLLCSGFIRQIQHKEDVNIPSEIMVLIEMFYVPNLLMIDSYKFQWGFVYRKGLIWDLWKSTGVDTSYWVTRLKRVRGIIFVIDLSTYDECLTDENGEKRNKLEYAHSLWASWKSIGTPKLTLLTKKDLFEQKIKEKPLNVCPLFADEAVRMDQLDLCTDNIHKKFKWASWSMSRLHVVNTSEVTEIQNYFLDLLRVIHGFPGVEKEPWDEPVYDSAPESYGYDSAKHDDPYSDSPYGDDSDEDF